MSKKKNKKNEKNHKGIAQAGELGMENLRLAPENRVCSQFDDYSIKNKNLPKKKMGVRVVDNCAEEHIM